MLQGGKYFSNKSDEIVIRNGVKIMGDANILNKLPISASNLYSKIFIILFLICMIKKNRLI